MKSLLYLITFIVVVAGCTPQIKTIYTDRIVEVPVVLRDTIIVEGSTNTGEAITPGLTAQDTSLVWDWTDATTTVTIAPQDSAVRYVVKTIVKTKTIPVTIVDTVQVICRDTVFAECPPVVPDPPVGSPWWVYVIYTGVAGGMFAWASASDRKKKKNEKTV